MKLGRIFVWITAAMSLSAGAYYLISPESMTT